jgi:hypothetical protein
MFRGASLEPFPTIRKLPPWPELELRFVNAPLTFAFSCSVNFAQPFSIHLERFLGGSIQTKQDGAFGRLRQAS